jgi:hypothetical protein
MNESYYPDESTCTVCEVHITPSDVEEYGRKCEPCSITNLYESVPYVPVVRGYKEQ